MHDVEKVIKRSRRSWYVDGVADLYLGILFCLAGLYRLIMYGLLALVNPLYLKVYLKETADPLLSMLLAWFPICSLVIPLLVFLYLIKMITQRIIALKERVTYPRIGYVEPRLVPLHKRLLMGFLWGTGYGLVYIFAQKVLKTMNVDLVLVSLICTFICLYAAIILAQTRYYILTSVSILLLIILSQAIIVEDMKLTLYAILMGVALMISGGITLRNFIRQNPIPKEDLS